MKVVDQEPRRAALEVASPYMTRQEAADWWRCSVDTVDRKVAELGLRILWGPTGRPLLDRQQITSLEFRPKGRSTQSKP